MAVSVMRPLLAERDLAALHGALVEHRLARLDQLDALKYGTEGVTDLDPVARADAITAARRALAATEEALHRMAMHTYGRCLRCLASIPADRLYTVPHARECIGCAGRR